MIGFYFGTGNASSGGPGTGAFDVTGLSRFTYIHDTGGTSLDYFFWNTGQATAAAAGIADNIDSIGFSSSTAHRRAFQAAFDVGSSTGGVGSELTFDVSANSYSEGWCSVGFNINYGTTGDAEVFYLSGATTKLFRIIALNTSEDWKAQYWDGSAWQDITATITAPDLSVNDAWLAIHWNIADSGGIFEVFDSFNNVSLGSFSGDTLLTADTTIDTIGVVDIGSNGNVTGIMVNSTDTRLNRVEEDRPLSNGTSVTVTGDVADVNNFVSENSADFVTADADNEEALFAFQTINAAFSSWTVDKVELAIEAQAQVEPALYGHWLVRSGGTNYESTEFFQAVTAQEDKFTLAYPNDPDTGSAWADVAAVDAAEWGFRASSS